MKQQSGKVSKHILHFVTNSDAVLGLPLRLTVSLIIGIVALAAILSYIYHPCLLPRNMVVSITPMVGTISSDDPTDVSFIVFVNDSAGHSVSGASVFIKGLGGAGSNVTDDHGKAGVRVTVHIEKGSLEGYLDVTVKTACYNIFSYNDMIKIVRKSM